MPLSAISASGHACLLKINRRKAQLPPDLVDNPRYVVDSSLWDTWLGDEHDLRRQTFFVDHAPIPPQARTREHSARAPSPSRWCMACERARVDALPVVVPATMTAKVEELMKKVLEDSKIEYKRSQWNGLECSWHCRPPATSPSWSSRN